MERDIGTFKRLHGKKRLQFVMDYYKWYILAAIVIILIIASFAHMFYEGQKDYRLRICAVLNTDRFCSSWFDDFEKNCKKTEMKHRSSSMKNSRLTTMICTTM